jgi:hypothetical protein
METEKHSISTGKYCGYNCLWRSFTPPVWLAAIMYLLWQTCVSAELQRGPIRHNGAKKSCSWNIKTHYLRFKHFIPHYLDVDTIFGDLGVNACSKKYHI